MFDTRFNNRLVALGLAFSILATACSSSPDPNLVFCDQLKTATGPDGAESAFSRYDVDRMDETTQELRGLLEVAPPDMRATMQEVVELFEQTGSARPADIAELLIEQERSMRILSSELTEFAVTECGLFLQRAPQPTPTPAPILLTE